MYKLSNKSRQKLVGVHDDMRRVVERAIQITEIDFAVGEGVRTFERQFELWKSKASKLNGIPKGQLLDGVMGTGVGSHQYGEAVDLWAYISGGIAWDWPLYFKIAYAMRKAAIEEGVSIVWGGVWDRTLNSLTEDLEEEMHQYSLRMRKRGKKPFNDGPHFQLAKNR